MVENYQPPGVVAWSMDLDLLQEIAALIRKSNRDYLEEDYYECSKTLVAIKLCFINSLTDKERKYLKKIEEKMKVPSIAHKFKNDEEWLYSSEYTDEQRRVITKLIANKNNLKNIVEEYREEIMDLLDMYGYIAKKKRDRVKMGF